MNWEERRSKMEKSLKFSLATRFSKEFLEAANMNASVSEDKLLDSLVANVSYWHELARQPQGMLEVFKRPPIGPKWKRFLLSLIPGIRYQTTYYLVDPDKIGGTK